MKKINNLNQFQNVLPYASELFGVYQPLLGWKSKRMKLRFQRGLTIDKNIIYPKLFGDIESNLEFDLESQPNIASSRSQILRLKNIRIGELMKKERQNQSFLIDSIKNDLPREEEINDDIWEQALSEEKLQSHLNRIVGNEFSAAYNDVDLKRELGSVDAFNQFIIRQANKESAIATYLIKLKENKDTQQLKKLFFKKTIDLFGLFKLRDPFETIDPHKDLGRVVISPISIVHIFRQYFFEFDTFLGTPVEHVWLSPGSSVELVETSTRRTLKEKTFESEFETTIKTEEELKELDEISTSIKEENKSNTKFGFNVEVEQGWIGGSAKATSSLNIDNTQKSAREVTHRHMKEQSKKLSTEIRKNYKTSFKTITEVTDTKSKRYLLNNTTDELLNYELRRKMRQVGVQVQDIGTYLCWQTYVDDPGKQLGISQLVHIAEPADLEGIPEPESVPYPEGIKTEEVIDITWSPATKTTVDEDKDELYINGVEHDTEGATEGEAERIYHRYPNNTFSCKKSGYKFDRVSFNGQGAHIEAIEEDVDNSIEGQVTFTVNAKKVNFRGADVIKLKATLFWLPSEKLKNSIDTQNETKIASYNMETQRAFEKAYVDAARERIKLASKIKSRKFEELREEERIVIYRRLLQDMLTKDLPLNDNRTRHAVSELLNSIFDFDKMLYFVAPEWWRPKLHRSQQNLGGFNSPPVPLTSTTTSNNKPKSLYSYSKVNKDLYKIKKADPIANKHKVGWGGIHESGRENYYITEESESAKLGSSLGWLLQLDGDNLRNQFLNAPWVKAVIPIRPGKEKTAFNWLRRVEVEGSDGLDGEYIATSAELNQIPHSGSKVTIQDAINHLCDKVQQKHQDASKVGLYPKDEINDDNKVSATPIDKVYEHGFYPNQGGFKLNVNEPFEVFDQWIEILPTDQIVPVEVKYDSKTGRQI